MSLNWPSRTYTTQLQTLKTEVASPTSLVVSWRFPRPTILLNLYIFIISKVANK